MLAVHTGLCNYKKMLMSRTAELTSLGRPAARAGEERLRLRLFGAMEAAAANGDSALPNGRKTRALLAMLALAAPRPVSRAWIAETLWSGRPEEQARGSLRQEIHRLLDCLGPLGPEVLAIGREQIALRPGTTWIDVAEVLRATPAMPEALRLIGGELLADLSGLDPAADLWLAGERNRVRGHARAVAEALLAEQTTPDGMITAAQQLLAIDQTHEGAWRALIHAYAVRGERGLAIEAFGRCRAALAQALDALPSDETRELLAEIRSGNAPPLKSRSPIAVPPQVRSGRRLGVLPLQNFGDDSHGRGSAGELAIVIAEEITSALTPFRWLDLVSCSALARFATETRDETALRRAFGLDFLVDGTLQRQRTTAGDMHRVTLRLIDLHAGNHIAWVQRFDHRADDPLGLQDRVAALAAARIDLEAQHLEIRRAAQPQASAAGRVERDISAYEAMLRARGLMVRLDRTQFLAAGSLLDLAAELDPDYAAPRAEIALWNALLIAQGWAANPEEARARAAAAAQQAIAIDPQDARAFAIAGYIKSALARRHDEALAFSRRAVTLNPNLPLAWGLAGITELGRGDLSAAEQRFARYKELVPLDPQAFVIDLGLALLAFLRGDFETTAILAREISEIRPSFRAVYPMHLAALGHLGRNADAAQVRARFGHLDPSHSVVSILDQCLLSRAADRDLLAEGLRLAGVPELPAR